MEGEAGGDKERGEILGPLPVCLQHIDLVYSVLFWCTLWCSGVHYGVLVYTSVSRCTLQCSDVYYGVYTYNIHTSSAYMIDSISVHHVI